MGDLKSKKDLLVCHGCGKIVQNLKMKKCSSCKTSLSGLERLSRELQDLQTSAKTTFSSLATHNRKLLDNSIHKFTNLLQIIEPRVKMPSWSVTLAQQLLSQSYSLGGKNLAVK